MRYFAELFVFCIWLSRPVAQKGVFSFIKILKIVSCEYDRWVVETQLCKLRGTSDTLIGRACAMVQLKYGVRELLIYDMVYYAQYVRRKKRPKESKRG